MKTCKACWLLLVVLLVTGCDSTSAQRQGELRATMSAILKPAVTVVEQTVIVRVPVTPVPSPTATATSTATPNPTPAPARGAAVAPDPALVRAVQAALTGLGPNFSVDGFTRTTAGDLIAWVSDRTYPGMQYCGSPLYFPGLGSLLVLTSSNLYAALVDLDGLPEGQGCIAVGLEAGREQVRAVLEFEQAVLDAAEAGQHFNDPASFNAYLQHFTQQHASSAYPAELNLLFMPLFGADRSASSAGRSACQQAPASACPEGRETHSVGPLITLAGSPGQHVPILFARTLDLIDRPVLLDLFAENWRQLVENRSQITPLRNHPLTIEEGLASRLAYDFWYLALSGSAYAAGLSQISPSHEDASRPGDAYLSALTANAGLGAERAYISAYQAMQVSANDLHYYKSGQFSRLALKSAEHAVELLRSFLDQSYLKFIVLPAASQ